MTLEHFALGVLRLAAVLGPVVYAARAIGRAYLPLTGAPAGLAQAVVAIAILLVGAEALGVLGLLKPVALIALFVVLAVSAWLVTREQAAGTRPTDDRPPSRPGARGFGAGARGFGAGARGFGALRVDAVTASAAAGVVVVAAQWCLDTANSLGGGIFSFDSLWYHLPFAARFAQTGSITAIQFTLADAFTAYFPANSELFHALGIALTGGDLLSPFLNLGWLAMALAAAWCLGRPWAMQRQTLLAGCLVMGLPVLSASQPGQAFNDVTGLATLLAGAALIVNSSADVRVLAVACLALGVAAGTKLTFIVPAVVLVVGAGFAACRAKRGHAPRRAAGNRASSTWRAGTMVALVVPFAVTSGWWYLRNAIKVGNPFGLQLHLGPLALGGATSALANQAQGTVISNVQHFSLWGSRFIPGLFRAVGPLWPLILGGTFYGLFWALRASAPVKLRLIAIAGCAAALIYVFLPTSASGIQQGSLLFEVNLRYMTPAVAFGVLIAVLLPVVDRERSDAVSPLRDSTWLAGALLAMLVITQFGHGLWSTQPFRHVAFLAAVAAIVVGGLLAARALARRAPSRLAIVMGTVIGAIVAFGAAYAVQRHYFARRYVVAGPGQPSGLYRWAQTIAHARIALYGIATAYPLYGARDTNHLDYLGMPSPDGSFVPIDNCRRWRETINEGRYEYVVLTPAPTPPVPLTWTADDPAAKLVLQPERGEEVFRLMGELNPATCPA